MTFTPPRRQLFGVEGLWCGACANGLERRLADVAGVRQARVHFLTRSAFLEWEPDCIDKLEIAECAERAGFRLVAPRTLAQTREALGAAELRLIRRFAVAVFFGMWAMAPALVLYLAPPQDSAEAWMLGVASGVFAAPALVVAGADLFAMALRSIRLRSPSFDLMIALGVGAAVAASVRSLVTGQADVYFDAASMLVSLAIAARLIDLRLRRRAIEALAVLEGDLAQKAILAETGVLVGVADIAAGTRVLVEAGAEISMDGVIETGTSSIDQAVLTGESVHMSVGPGTRVSAGALNLRQAIVLRTDRVAGDRDIDRIGGRVALELAARPALADPAGRLAGWLGAGLPVLGFLVAAGHMLAGAPGLLAAQHGLAAMIVICPCALVLARPMAHIAAVAAAARHGIRVIEPGALEALGKVRIVLFDKTGTLTAGSPVVEDVTPAPGWTAPEVLEAAARAEAGIDHPIARAILSAAGPGPTAGERLARGARGIWNGQSVHVGPAPTADGHRTVVQVEIDNCVAGLIHLADRVRPEAPFTVAAFANARIAIGIASGDQPGAVEAVAKACGFASSGCHAALTPQDKADLIHRSERPVAFVGDGVNDAPAFAAADVGIAVAGAHSAAMRTAQIVLSGGISDIIRARGLGRRLNSTLRLLLAATVCYNLGAGVAGAAGQVTPAAAACLMTVNSVLTAVLAWAPFARQGPPVERPQVRSRAIRRPERVLA